MRKFVLTAAALCAVAFSGSMALAGDMTPTTGESQAVGGVPTGGNQPNAAAVPSRAAMSVSNEGRSARRMRRHRAKNMMMKEGSSGVAPGGAKAGVGGMGAPAAK